MPKIRIDTENLYKNKADLENLLLELEKANNAYQSVINRISDLWKGEAGTEYVRVMLGYKKQAENMVRILTEFKKYVETAIKKFEEVDSESAKRIRGAF